MLMSEELVKDKIIRQTDSGLGVDARADPGGPSSPEALLIRTLPHDLVMGGLSRAGSQHYITHFIKWSKQLKLNYASKEYWLLCGGDDWDGPLKRLWSVTQFLYFYL